MDNHLGLSRLRRLRSSWLLRRRRLFLLDYFSWCRSLSLLFRFLLYLSFLLFNLWFLLLLEFDGLFGFRLAPV